jgi:hypothetical protein
MTLAKPPLGGLGGVRWPDKQPEAFGLPLNFLWSLSLFQDKESDKVFD